MSEKRRDNREFNRNSSMAVVLYGSMAIFMNKDIMATAVT